MTSKEMQSAVVFLSADDPYFKLMSTPETGNSPNSWARRLQIALADPALFAHICQSYAEVRLPLPAFQWPPAVIRAHHFFSNPNSEDANLAMARDLQLPESRFERNVIRGLLMCQNVSYEQIAEVFQLEPEVVTLFEFLWWHVRDRNGELLYVAQLLSGKHSSVDPEEDAESEELGLRLRRVGRSKGNMRDVLVEAGLVHPASEALPEAALSEQILRRFIERILVCQQRGQLGKRELALLEKHLSELQAEPFLTDPFLALSQNKQAQATIKEMVRAQTTAKLQAQRLGWAKARESKEVADYEI